MTWLVTGGAGYIGAHIVRALLAEGEEVVVFDDLSTGVKDRVPDGVELIVGSVLDRTALDVAFTGRNLQGVVHLAGKKQVAESVERPLFYYRENVDGLRTLVEAMVDHKVRRIVFSSSAAVYGMPDVDLVDEQTPCQPLSPYGETKLAGERLIAAAARAHGLDYVNIRYFNVAGTADPALADRGAANLIPMVFREIAVGSAPRVFGDDYPTPDGTCVRDYIHVVDLAAAHVAAARRLVADGATALTVNAGRGEGVSVREVLDVVAEVTGLSSEPVIVARRPGDAASVVASAETIREELGWHAELDLRSMVESAWAAWRR